MPSLEFKVFSLDSKHDKGLNTLRNKKILLVQLRQLGDILLTTPCTREIKQNNPDCEIVFLSHKMGKLVLDDNPYINEHLLYDEKQSLSEQWQLIKKIRSYKFDLVIDFMNNPRSALLTLLSAGKTRLSFKSARSLAYNHVIENKKRSEYIVAEKFQLLEAAGFTSQNKKLILPWSENHLQPLLKFSEDVTEFKNAPIRVMLSPTHRRENRKWSLEKYALIADLLVEKWQASVIWLWGPGEESDVEQAMSFCKQKTFKAPATSFRELAAFIGNADLFIGNSNGPSHVAVANDICSLQLHGHTNMRSWCPLNQKHRAIQSSEFGQVDATLNSIAVDQVWQTLEDFKPEILVYASKRQKLGIRKNYFEQI